MLRDKDINKISELKSDFTPRWLEPDFISSSLKCFSFSRLCRVVSDIKVKGYGFDWIMTILLSMPFIDAATIHSMLNGCVKHHIQGGKDVFYRLKNHQGICWRMVLWLFASKFTQLTGAQSQTCGPRCMIFDDTLLEKTGKKIEKVSRMWDHVMHRYLLGFKLLLLGYWDGTSFYPAGFHHASGAGKEQGEAIWFDPKGVQETIPESTGKGKFFPGKKHGGGPVENRLCHQHVQTGYFSGIQGRLCVNGQLVYL